MALTALVNMNICDELRKMFRDVIGRDMSGDVAKFVIMKRVDKGDCAVVVTTTGDVYAISFAENGSGDEQCSSRFPHLRSRKLLEICGLGIVDIATGGKFRGPQHVLVTTSNGRVYSWGSNLLGQLGLIGMSSSVLPRLIRGPLEQRTVAKVACGCGFSACVTVDGQLWTWGHNDQGQLGDATVDNQSTNPRRVQGSLDTVRVVSVACGRCFMMALSDRGQLWSWGHNVYGQLGRGDSHIQRKPSPGGVHLPGNPVVKSIACGSYHALASTATGYLYAWGRNDFGQLGGLNFTAMDDDEDQEGSWTPLKVHFADQGLPSGERPCMPSPADCPCVSQSAPCRRHSVSEVAAYHRMNVPACKMANGEMYVWGECGGGRNRVITPLLVTNTDLDTLFLSLSSPPITFRPVSMVGLDPPAKRPSLHACLRESFDNPIHADIKFVSEGKAIHVQKAFLKIRSEHFRCMFSDGAAWAETASDTIHIKDYTYLVYRAFLYYLYTETLVENLPPNDLMGLLDLAQCYFEDELRAMCVTRISETMTCESVVSLYAGAVRRATKDIEEICCDFMVQHLSELTASGALRGLGEDVLLNLLQKVAQKRNNHRS